MAAMPQRISMPDSDGKTDDAAGPCGNIKWPTVPPHSEDLSAELVSSCARRIWLHLVMSGNALGFERARPGVPQQAQKTKPHRRCRASCTPVNSKDVNKLCESDEKQRIRLHRKCGQNFWYAKRVPSTPSQKLSTTMFSSPTFTPPKTKGSRSNAAMKGRLDWKTYDVEALAMPQLQTPLAWNSEQT